jgi:hypothetical protein
MKTEISEGKDALSEFVLFKGRDHEKSPIKPQMA